MFTPNKREPSWNSCKHHKSLKSTTWHQRNFYFEKSWHFNVIRKISCISYEGKWTYSMSEISPTTVLGNLINSHFRRWNLKLTEILLVIKTLKLKLVNRQDNNPLVLDQDYHTPQDDVEVMERKGRVSTFLEGKLSRKVTGGCNCFLESKGKWKSPWGNWSELATPAHRFQRKQETQHSMPWLLSMDAAQDTERGPGSHDNDTGAFYWDYFTPPPLLPHQLPMAAPAHRSECKRDQVGTPRKPRPGRGPSDKHLVRCLEMQLFGLIW